MNQLDQLKSDLRHAADPVKAAFFPRFFKAGPGQYAEGDKFLGVTVPMQRQFAKKYKDLSLEECAELIKSPWHEERLTALFILAARFKKSDPANKKAIYDFYLAHTAHINNWDLVDSSAEHIVGAYLEDKPEKMRVLKKLATSPSLWERRIAMLSTFCYIKQGRAEEAFEIIEILKLDTHDLLHKAVGWMLREIGKRAGRDLLKHYLNEHAHELPRTALRYAIEHLSPDERAHYMAKKA